MVGAACQVGTAVLSPAAPCGSTAAVLGDSTAGCVSGALAGVTQPRSASGTGSGGTAAGVIQRAVAPVTSVLGVTAPAPRGLTGERVRSIFDNQPGASGAGDTNVPAASQLAGLGALPGLADLPSLAGFPRAGGASALKIAGRRARDRKAGFGAMI